MPFPTFRFNESSPDFYFNNTPTENVNEERIIGIETDNRLKSHSKYKRKKAN